MDEPELFTAQGRLLVQVMRKPGITIKELAEDLFLTERSIWGHMGGLRRAGYLGSSRIKGTEFPGQTNHYYITTLGLAKVRGEGGRA